MPVPRRPESGAGLAPARCVWSPCAPPSSRPAVLPRRRPCASRRPSPAAACVVGVPVFHPDAEIRWFPLLLLLGSSRRPSLLRRRFPTTAAALRADMPLCPSLSVPVPFHPRPRRCAPLPRAATSASSSVRHPGGGRHPRWGSAIHCPAAESPRAAVTITVLRWLQPFPGGPSLHLRMITQATGSAYPRERTCR
jgi:hypothetical protein